VNDKFLSHPAMTAVGLLCKIFVEKRQTADMKPLVAQLVKDLPAYDVEHKAIDFYYWYYAALAMFQYDAPNGAGWQAFNKCMKSALVPFQAGYRNTSGKVTCTDGSWDPAVDKWGIPAGRVYTTAINVLTLEVYYRYANVFGTKRESGAAEAKK